MPDPYRRSIEELITRYELEPQLRDIYVEGDRDRFFLNWFLVRSGCRQAVVYPIETSVYIPPVLLARNRVSGNRGRVIVLCLELAAKLSRNSNNVLGLVDKDYSQILGESVESHLLLWTDFSCLESYALSDRALQKFCSIYLGVVISVDRFSEMFVILRDVFLLRCAKLACARSAAWLDAFTRLCSIRDGRVYFDRAQFVDRLLNASAGAIDRGSLEAKVAELRGLLSGGFRQELNGHDLIQMFSWYAHQIGVDRSIYSKTPLQRALLTCVEFEELSRYTLFQRLLEWCAVGEKQA